MLKKTLLLASMLMSITHVALAADEERWFEVEVYIFERQGQAFEQMDSNPANINQRQSVDMITPLFKTDITGASLGLEGCTEQEWVDDAERCNHQLSSTQISYPSTLPVSIGASDPQYAKEGESTVLLADSQAQFSEMINTLNREPGLKGLLHMTWQQSMQPRNLATPVRLVAGHDFSEQYQQNGYPIDKQAVSEIPQFSFNLGLGQSTIKKPLWQLDGAINIYLDHYLYVETALTLREEGSKTPTRFILARDSDANSAPEPIPFLFKVWMAQNKRVISDEIHYLDHPNLGMILQIRKMVQPNEMTPELLAELQISDDQNASKDKARVEEARVEEAKVKP
ncbi:peptidoglycan binding protein CsiV [Shewanella sp. AS1]|uniref:peptidoglycan binding protein CsiV n=1 Tax=Shewanella sp. AS1 TaxID=2907626 RepID=UPI001F2A70ED|nr:peptidoglycan binding protein CsiV [Shewanella sp. AS1]MCE9678387.1 peptidoglycan binding protein CsiV [Shewanella sp. AS1]